MAVLLDRALELDSSKTAVNPYDDISYDKNSWSYDAIIRLTNAGVLKGTSDKSFNPLGKTTRAEMAAMMDRIDEKEY
jgi:hypothetical protein